MFRRWLANGGLGQVPVMRRVCGVAVARCELATIERFDVRIFWNERRDIVAAESDNGRAIFAANWPVETVVVAVTVVGEWKEAGRRKDQGVHTRADRCAIRIGCGETNPISEEVVLIFSGEFHTLSLVSISAHRSARHARTSHGATHVRSPHLALIGLSRTWWRSLRVAGRGCGRMR